MHVKGLVCARRCTAPEKKTSCLNTFRSRGQGQTTTRSVGHRHAAQTSAQHTTSAGRASPSQSETASLKRRSSASGVRPLVEERTSAGTWKRGSRLKNSSASGVRPLVKERTSAGTWKRGLKEEGFQSLLFVGLGDEDFVAATAAKLREETW